MGVREYKRVDRPFVKVSVMDLDLDRMKKYSVRRKLDFLGIR